MEVLVSSSGGYSQRLLDRQSHPKFLTDETDKNDFLEASLPGSFSFEAHFPEGRSAFFFGLIDPNQPECPIVDMKFNSNFQDEKMAFLDAVVQLCIKRSELTLSTFQLREVESFLRDQNDIPALPGNGAPFYPYFSKLIEGLKKAIEETRGRRPGEKASPTISDDYHTEGALFDPSIEGVFVDMDQSKKSSYVNAALSRYVRPFLYRDYGDIECLFIDGPMIVVQYTGACATCTKSLTTTMDYIQEVLRKELQEPGIMVVTDS